MQLLLASPQALQLALLLLLVPLILHCATNPSHNAARLAVSPICIRDEDNPVQPSAQPFSTQPVEGSALSPQNTAIPNSQPYTFRLLQLHTILASPETMQHVYRTLEHACQVFAYALLDDDLLYEQDLAVRLGDFTLHFHAVAEYLSMQAVKTVMMKLIQMLQNGLLGFFEGELINAQPAVRMILTFGVVGGAL